ncbi:MAG: hypothetical protein EOM55_00665 [Clostridia bacterium]|nr:hypothetical protein [Clostridia bacterium]
MIDNKMYGSSEEIILKERCQRENFLVRQENFYDKKTAVKNKIKSSCEKLMNSFLIFKKEEEKEIVKDENKEINNELKINNENKEMNEKTPQEQERFMKEEDLKLKARMQKSDFIKFVESRLKETNSSELFEVTKDKFDRIIIHAFSQEHSVRKVINTSTKGDYEGFINVDNGDGIEKCYYYLTYCFEKDDQMISYGSKYSSKDILCGFIINEEGNVYFMKDEIKIGSQSLATNIYHKAEKAVSDMIKKQKQKEDNSETITF